jgi:hypothetical protein
MVAAAMHNRSWIAQLRGGVTVPAIHEYLRIWDELWEIKLADEEDRMI